MDGTTWQLVAMAAIAMVQVLGLAYLASRQEKTHKLVNSQTDRLIKVEKLLSYQEGQANQKKSSAASAAKAKEEAK